jgi:benzil reductase ((S)-benzoin forming)
MNYFFITGSSKGLGKALAELLLKDDFNKVYGIARTSSIQHSNYTHISLDLADLPVVKSFLFPKINEADKVVLVNNAGIVGDVKHVGNINNDKIIDCYNLNLIAPTILTNMFVAAYGQLDCDKMILNISSGAGRNPIDGWSIYCSTKSGLDMFSQVLNEEAKIDENRFTVLSLAPGIIDTGMQDNIRESNAQDFSNIQRFIDYKNQGDLASSNDTAEQVLKFIFNKELAENVLCSVRDLKK